jgi:hypothetical protein
MDESWKGLSYVIIPVVLSVPSILVSPLDLKGNQIRFVSVPLHEDHIPLIKNQGRNLVIRRLTLVLKFQYGPYFSYRS